MGPRWGKGVLIFAWCLGGFVVKGQNAPFDFDKLNSSTVMKTVMSIRPDAEEQKHIHAVIKTTVQECPVSITQVEAVLDVAIVKLELDRLVDFMSVHFPAVLCQAIRAKDVQVFYGMLRPKGSLALPSRKSAAEAAIRLSRVRVDPDVLRELHEIVSKSVESTAVEASLDLFAARADVSALRKAVDGVTEEDELNGAYLSAVEAFADGLESRISSDGAPRVASEFSERFGPRDWLAAYARSPRQKRAIFTTDGQQIWYLHQFVSHFGKSSAKWGRKWMWAPEFEERRTLIPLKLGGELWTMKEFQIKFPAEWQEKWNRAFPAIPTRLK